MRSSATPGTTKHAAILTLERQRTDVSDLKLKLTSVDLTSTTGLAACGDRFVQLETDNEVELRILPHLHLARRTAPRAAPLSIETCPRPEAGIQT